MPEEAAGAGPPGVLAIVAGRGDLPRRIAERRREAGLPVLLVVFRGYLDDWMADYPHQEHEFERAGALLRGLKAAGVGHIVFAGAMTRPKLKLWRADFRAVRLLLRALGLLARGDDAMLRGFGAIFEEEGIGLLSPREILGEALTVRPGALGRARPATRDLDDARRAAAIVGALAALDVGQAAVVARGLCLGIEAIGGTDLLLEQVSGLPAERRQTAPPPSGVLYKGPKPGQDLRFDLPAIGPGTVAGAAKAGLAGIVVMAGQTLLLDEAGTRRAADEAGLFIYGATAGELGAEPG